MCYAAVVVVSLWLSLMLQKYTIIHGHNSICKYQADTALTSWTHRYFMNAVAVSSARHICRWRCRARALLTEKGVRVEWFWQGCGRWSLCYLNQFALNISTSSIQTLLHTHSHTMFVVHRDAKGFRAFSLSLSHAPSFKHSHRRILTRVSFAMRVAWATAKQIDNTQNGSSTLSLW